MICVWQEKENDVEAILNVKYNEHKDNYHNWKCLKRN